MIDLPATSRAAGDRKETATRIPTTGIRSLRRNRADTPADPNSRAAVARSRPAATAANGVESAIDLENAGTAPDSATSAPAILGIADFSDPAVPSSAATSAAAAGRSPIGGRAG